MSTGAVVAAARRVERRLIRHFREAGATGPASAIGPPDLGLIASRSLDRLARAGVLVEASPGRYHLDEPAYAAYASRRRRRALAIVAAVVLVIVVVFASGLVRI